MTNQVPKISIVSYLNSKPFLYGMFVNAFDQEIELSLDIPAVLAQKLITNKVDLGLVPVAAIPDIPDAQIISDFCIGTVGAVQTVCIYSEVPIHEITALYLDHHSKTSAVLTQILLKEYWNLDPNLLKASEGYIKDIKGSRAGLVIGDRTMGLQEQFKYCYDLGAHWKMHTDLPFVFAAWVANKSLSSKFIQAFNQALSTGLQRIPQVAQLFQSSHQSFDVLAYYQQYISYELDDKKKAALELFLAKKRRYNL